MKIIHEITRNELLVRFQSSRDFKFIEWALNNHRYFFLVALDGVDLQNLILNSSPRNPEPEPNRSRHPSLIEAVQEIREDRSFLSLEAHQDFRGLNGKRVNDKIEYFEHGGTLKECFIMDVWPGMFRDEPYYVIDGMHSLVAYALWSNLNSAKFPIAVICCTNVSYEGSK